MTLICAVYQLITWSVISCFQLKRKKRNLIFICKSKTWSHDSFRRNRSGYLQPKTPEYIISLYPIKLFCKTPWSPRRNWEDPRVIIPWQNRAQLQSKNCTKIKSVFMSVCIASLSWKTDNVIFNFLIGEASDYVYIEPFYHLDIRRKYYFLKTNYGTEQDPCFLVTWDLFWLW